MQGPEEQCTRTASTLNRAEVKAVACLVRLLAQQHREQAASGEVRQLSVGVISPYAAQVKEITKELQHLLGKNSMAGLLHLEVKSVDGFQGREMDLVIVSTVRNNPQGTVGFLKVGLLTELRWCMQGLVLPPPCARQQIVRCSESGRDCVSSYTDGDSVCEPESAAHNHSCYSHEWRCNVPLYPLVALRTSVVSTWPSLEGAMLSGSSATPPHWRLTW